MAVDNYLTHGPLNIFALPLTVIVNSAQLVASIGPELDDELLDFLEELDLLELVEAELELDSLLELDELDELDLDDELDSLLDELLEELDEVGPSHSIYL